MHALGVEQQPDRRPAAVAAGPDRAEEGVFDPQHRRIPARGDGFAPRAGRALAPDPDQVGHPGRRAKPDAVAGEVEDPADPALCQEAAVIDEKTPPGSGGVGRLPRRGRHRAAYSVAIELATLAAERVPVAAAITLLNCTKGASVT